jgi:hypothetical protein
MIVFVNVTVCFTIGYVKYMHKAPYTLSVKLSDFTV